jgi:hypothetical protein
VKRTNNHSIAGDDLVLRYTNLFISIIISFSKITIKCALNSNFRIKRNVG